MTRERTRLSRVVQLCATAFAIGVFGLAALKASSAMLGEFAGTAPPPPIDITISAATTFAVADGLDGSTDGTLNADNLTIANGGSITCNDSGVSGASACPITIVVGDKMVMEADSKITAENTNDGGNGGNITITVGTSMTMCGPNGGQVGCASAAGEPGAVISARKTSGAGDTGVGGNITITVGNLATVTGAFYMEGGVTTYGAETGAKILTGGTGPAGDVTVTSGGTYFTEPGAVIEAGGPAVSQTTAGLGGKVYLVSGCGFTTEGRITSKGTDPGADLVHLESCEVIVRGLVESTGEGHGVAASPAAANRAPANSCDGFSDSLTNEIVHTDKPANATGCIEVWGKVVTIDATNGWAGALNTDIGDGGTSGMGWIDIFADAKLTVTDGTGNDRLSNNGGGSYFSTYAVHANTMDGSDSTTGTITAKVKNGPITASGKAFEASATLNTVTGHPTQPIPGGGDFVGNGSHGGTIDVQASGAVTLDDAWLNASGDFDTNGGDIIVRAWGAGSAINWREVVDGEAHGIVLPNATGTITLAACGAIDTTGTDFHGEVPATSTGGANCDASKPDLPAYVVFNVAAWTMCGASTISGRKYDPETNEGLANWEIHLFNADGSVHMVETTAAGGFYMFTNVPTGTYTVCEKLQSGWTQVFPASGANCATPGDPASDNATPGPVGYTIDTTAFCCSGQQITGKDFGNDPPVPPGSLKIIKSLDAGGSGFAGSFSIGYACDLGGPSGTVTLSGGGSQTIDNIPPGSSCTVSEPTLPAAPPGYSWGAVVITTSPASITSGTTVEVTVANSLTRDTGSLKIIKSLNAGGSGFAGSFSINYACDPGGPSGAVTLSGGGSQTINNIPTGSSCTVSEPTLPSPPPGYSWGAVVIAPNPALITTAGATVEVTVANSLTRDTGSLKIIKSLNAGGSGFAGSFSISYACDPGGPSGAVTLSGGGSQTINNIPTGSSCTVSEPTLPSPPPGYSWGAVVIAPNPALITTAGATVEVTVTNSLTRDTGSLKIIKSLNAGGSGFAGSFSINYACDPGGPSGAVTLSGGGSQTINNIPTGSSCTVSEPVLPAPPAGYSWGAVVITTSPALITTAGVTVEVTVSNSLTPTPPATGSLKITKYVTNKPGGGFFMASFTVHVECTAGGPFADKVLTYPFPGYVTYTNIPAGATCTVTEISKSAPPGGYLWDTETITPTPVPIPAGGTAYVSITNPLVPCPPPAQPSVSIIKTANKTWLAFGESVTYTYVVKNTGGVPLTNVVVVDDNATPSITADDVTVGTVASLAPGASATFTRTLVPPVPVCGNDYQGHGGTCGLLLTEHRSDGTTKFTYLQAKDGRDSYSTWNGWSGKRSYAQQTQFRIWNKNGTYTDVNATLGAGDGSKYFNSFSFVVNRSTVADANGSVKLPGIFHKNGWNRDWHLDWDKLYGDPTRRKYWDSVAPSFDKYTDRHTCSADVTNTAKVTATAGAQTLTASDSETVTVK